MDRQDVLKRLLYKKCKTALEFKFDSLIVDPLLSYISWNDIMQLNKIATSLKYSSKPKEKYMMIDNIMTNRGFKKMASGTNRVTYRCLNDYRIVIKIAIDKVGLSDNGNEYRNQQLLKPFVTKCFEVSPCGTVGLFERVVPITSREEFVNISDDIFDLINNLIGKYVLEDIGEKFYMNYGLREGFGPVLLDYPYVFELDGRKLICNVPEPLEPKGYCGGEIDYDIGYNDLICKKCGKRYLATELKADDKSGKPKIIIEGEDIIMKCVLRRGDEIVSKLNSEAPIATNTIKPRKDFVKLKAQIGVKMEEEKEDFKPEIKTRDDVQIQVKLRGRRTSKDIDKEAREKEARLDRVSEKIQVNLEPTFEEVKETPVSNISVSLSGNYSNELPAQKPVEVIEKPYVDETIGYDRSKAIYYKSPFFKAVIKNGQIWNVETNELVGYTCKDCNRDEQSDCDNESYEKEEIPSKLNTISDEVKTTDKFEELSEEEETMTLKNVKRFVEDETEEVVYKDSEESTGATIGDIMKSKDTFKYNGGYKTADIVSPVESYLSSAPVEDSKEDPVEESEIPEVVIIPREEDDEEDYPSYDEEYDPEYSTEDEEKSEESLLEELY